MNEHTTKYWNRKTNQEHEMGARTKSDFDDFQECSRSIGILLHLRRNDREEKDFDTVDRSVILANIEET